MAVPCTLFCTTQLMAQWQPLNGPEGQFVRSILCHDGTVYAATGGTKSLAVMGDIIYLATDENVFRTADEGNSWQPCSTQLQGIYCKHILAHDG